MKKLLENELFSIVERSIGGLEWRDYLFSKSSEILPFICYKNIPLVPVAKGVNIKKCEFYLTSDGPREFGIMLKVFCGKKDIYDLGYYPIHGLNEEEVNEWLENPTDLKIATDEEKDMYCYVLFKQSFEEYQKELYGEKPKSWLNDLGWKLHQEGFQKDKDIVLVGFSPRTLIEEKTNQTNLVSFVDMEDGRYLASFIVDKSPKRLMRFLQNSHNRIIKFVGRLRIEERHKDQKGLWVVPIYGKISYI